jgi:hypothetical protein
MSTGRWPDGYLEGGTFKSGTAAMMRIQEKDETMNYFTYVGSRLDEQRTAELVRERELLRLQTERPSSPMPAAEPPVRRGPWTAAWSSLREIAHLGHRVAH